MPSELKSETARINGAKSNGPVTLGGRAKSSKNAVRHGLTAKAVVLPTESEEDFQLLLDSYRDQFHPQTDFEMDLVETLATTRWRLRRLCTLETSLFERELESCEKWEEKKFADMSPDHRLAWAFNSMAGGQSLSLLIRYEGSLNRAFDRAFKQLHLLQSAKNRPQRNEPNASVIPDPPPAPESMQNEQLATSPPAVHSPPIELNVPSRVYGSPIFKGVSMNEDSEL